MEPKWGFWRLEEPKAKNQRPWKVLIPEPLGE